MSKRDRKQAARKREQSRHQEQRRQAAASRRQVFDPATPAEVVATTLAERFGEEPVSLDVAQDIAARADVARVRAVSDAALARARGPMSLSLAADAAIMEDRLEDAERYLVEALDLTPDAQLDYRLVTVLGGLGRTGDAIDVLDRRLMAEPILSGFHEMKAELLQEAHARGTAPDAVVRFRDRSVLRDALDAVERFVAADAERSEAFAAALGEWVEAGAITRSELDELPARAERNPRSRDAARHRMLQQWAWSAPVLDGGRSLLEAFAESDAGTQDQRRRAHDLTHARWGLWEVASQVSAPGVFVEELLTGERPYLDLPEDALSELPRWSTLIGCVVPVDGTWRAGDWFQVASPVEARLLVHEVFDQIIDHEKELGREGRPAVQMARQAHHEMGPFWLPQAMPLPSPEAAGLVLAVVRSMAPVMVASVRRMRGELLDEEEGARYFTVSVADQDAAWEALTRQPGFARDEADDDELAWLREPAGGAEPAEPRAWITFDEDGLGVEVEDRGDLDELLRLMETLGHPPRAVEEPIDEAPEPPVELPDLEGAELGEWLSEWPDVPLGGFEEAPTPRQLMEEDEGLVLEMLVRYMEHDADRRGVKDLDTDALRGELDLEVVEEGPARTGGDRALPTQTK